MHTFRSTYGRSRSCDAEVDFDIDRGILIKTRPHVEALSPPNSTERDSPVSFRICFVILSNHLDDSFHELIRALRTFCPDSDIAWYNSGRRESPPPGIRKIPTSRPLKYAKIAPALFDMLEWTGQHDYDCMVNVETDLAIIKPGFEQFIEEQMTEVDYLAHGFRRRTPTISMWPAYRGIQSELSTLLSILGMNYTNRCFNPAQAFSRKYISTLLSSDIYPNLRAFTERNQRPELSYVLEELILPTLADRFELSARPYPADVAIFNRYRPYHGPDDLALALRNPAAYFIHPVRRDPDDPVRAAVSALSRSADQ